MMLKKVLTFFLLIFCSHSFSQELNCQVSVIVDARVEVSSVEKEIIEQMKQSVTDLMNTTSWTKDKFTAEERINCALQIQIKTIPSLGNYTGYIQVQSTRPAFNSNYNSILFNFQDDNLIFSYSRNTPLLFSVNQYRDNLSSILAFYAYFIIGMDYDSYSLKGGSPYFLEAQQIVTNAQASNTRGWRSGEPGRKNRFWLVDNMMQPMYEPLRECNYLYHRKGIDHLYDTKPEAKKEMYNALSKLSPVVLTRRNNVSILNFLTSKIQEFKNVLSDSELKEKTEFVNLLKKLDSANSTLYNTILN
jgi:hypothetical protein